MQCFFSLVPSLRSPPCTPPRPPVRLAFSLQLCTGVRCTTMPLAVNCHWTGPVTPSGPPRYPAKKRCTAFLLVFVCHGKVTPSSPALPCTGADCCALAQASSRIAQLDFGEDQGPLLDALCTALCVPPSYPCWWRGLQRERERGSGVAGQGERPGRAVLDSAAARARAIGFFELALSSRRGHWSELAAMPRRP